MSQALINAAKAGGIGPAAQPTVRLFGHGLGFPSQAGLHPRREGACVSAGTNRFGRSWHSSHACARQHGWGTERGG